MKIFQHFFLFLWLSYTIKFEQIFFRHSDWKTSRQIWIQPYVFSKSVKSQKRPKLNHIFSTQRFARSSTTRTIRHIDNSVDRISCRGIEWLESMMRSSEKFAFRLGRDLAALEVGWLHILVRMCGKIAFGTIR